MSPASSKLRLKTSPALRKKPYALLPTSQNHPTHAACCQTASPALEQRPKASKTRTTQSSGRRIVLQTCLDRPDLPLLFLWLTTEGIEAGWACQTLTRSAAAWKPQTDHLGRLAATTNMVSQKGAWVALTQMG